MTRMKQSKRSRAIVLIRKLTEQILTCKTCDKKLVSEANEFIIEYLDNKQQSKKNKLN